MSVRKRVIKIMKDICVECPDFPKIPEICVKMIRRVNDEEGIRKLVMEVFQVRTVFLLREFSGPMIINAGSLFIRNVTCQGGLIYRLDGLICRCMYYSYHCSY